MDRTESHAGPVKGKDDAMAITRRALIHAGLGLALVTPSDMASAAPAPRFSAPQINLYSRDVDRAVAFYERLGFRQSFRTPATGPIDHIELMLGNFTIGIATMVAARDHHGLHPGTGHAIEIAIRTEDTDAALAMLTKAGAPLLSPPHDFLDGQLRAGWIADPDGNPVQIYQMR
jgi:catechol 2,3-dioxygenase-like lactoylglutathione lyase family enzyme